MVGHGIENAVVLEAEPDVVSLLKVLVRSLNPRYVIETGCYHGTTSKAIGESLTASGHLDTMDIDAYAVDVATRACVNLAVTVHHCGSLDFMPTQPIDFMFLDSGIDDLRAQELEHFRSYLAPDAVIAIHDSRDIIWPDLDGWRWVNLPTPRGLLLLQAGE